MMLTIILLGNIIALIISIAFMLFIWFDAKEDGDRVATNAGKWFLLGLSGFLISNIMGLAFANW